MSDDDYYKLLGLRFDATPEEIRSSYRKLARTYHPDVAPSEKDREHFQRVTEAYATLSDLQKRNAYNKSHGFPFVDFLDERETAPPPPDPQEAPAEKGKIGTALSNSKELWKKLRAGKDGPDSRVMDKVAQADPKELVADSNEEKIAAWGEFDEQGKGAQQGKSVLGWLRRGKSDRNIEELKKYQDNILRANNVAPVDEQTWQRDDSRKFRPVEEKTPGFAGPAEERVFQFRITDYESSLGTRRQIAFQSAGSEGFTRLNVKIPAGIKNGTRLQISRGWDRVAVNVEVVEDRFYRIDGSSIWVFVPLLLHEAVFGLECSLHSPEASVRCTFPGRERFLAQQLFGERGIKPEGGTKGDLFVQPYVVPGKCASEIVERAAGWTTPDLSEQAIAARSTPPPPFGQTSVVVVNVTPKELFLGGRVAFDANGSDTFEIPEAWAGGLLKSAKGREVVPFLLLPSGRTEEVDEVARTIRDSGVTSLRSEMITQ